MNLDLDKSGARRCRNDARIKVFFQDSGLRNR